MIKILPFLLITLVNCQLNGKFWWTDNRIGRFHKVNIPEPVIEDIDPYDTDESAKIIFRDTEDMPLKPIQSTKKVDLKANSDICNYVKEVECRGIIYSTKFGKSVKKGPRDPHLVCCLEAPNQSPEEDTKIYFSDHSKKDISHKKKRSVKFADTENKKGKDSLSDYYEDPYWNIKNSNFQTSQIKIKDNSMSDYTEDLPKPGLVGIYSDTGNRPTWSFPNPNPNYEGEFDYDETDDTPSFGYGPIDPRKDKKTNIKKQTLTNIQTQSQEIPYNPANFIISFQSNPDFKVFEGFKLLNIAKVLKNSPQNTNKDDQSKETLLSKPVDSSSLTSEEYFLIENDKLYNDCGKSTQIKENDKETEVAPIGSYPWLALIVDIRRNTFLCYATIIHPRAAITTAKCVNNQTLSDLTLIAGIQNLNQRSRTLNRIPKVVLPPDYIPGNLHNNLALLIWQVPLKLNPNLQPACLADPVHGENCMFFGWDRYRTGTRSRIWWMRAKISTCNSRSAIKIKNLPPEAFCVIVESQSNFIGSVGGPLICNVDGRDAIVGVVVIRRPFPILLPVQSWAMQAGDIVQEN